MINVDSLIDLHRGERLPLFFQNTSKDAKKIPIISFFLFLINCHCPKTSGFFFCIRNKKIFLIRFAEIYSDSPASIWKILNLSNRVLLILIAATLWKRLFIASRAEAWAKRKTTNHNRKPRFSIWFGALPFNARCSLMEFLQNKFVVRNKKIFLIRFAELFYSLTVIFFWIASLRSQWLSTCHSEAPAEESHVSLARDSSPQFI